MTKSNSSGGQFEGGLAHVRPRVVHVHVEAAQPLDRRLHQRLARLRGGDVGGEGDGATAQRLDLGHEAVEFGGGAAGEGEVGPGGGERERHRAPEPAPRARHDGDAAAQVEELRPAQFGAAVVVGGAHS